MRKEFRPFIWWLVVLFFGFTSWYAFEAATLCTGCEPYWSTLGDLYWIPSTLLDIFLLAMLVVLAILSITFIRQRTKREFENLDI